MKIKRETNHYRPYFIAGKKLDRIELIGNERSFKVYQGWLEDENREDIAEIECLDFSLRAKKGDRLEKFSDKEQGYFNTGVVLKLNVEILEVRQVTRRDLYYLVKHDLVTFRTSSGHVYTARIFKETKHTLLYKFFQKKAEELSKVSGTDITVYAAENLVRHFRGK